jgi:hypothetical protein
MRTIRTLTISLCALWLLPWTLAGTARAEPTCEAPSEQQAKTMYRWKRRQEGYTSLACRVPAPTGFARVPAAQGSYGHWLRHLPLLPDKTPVRSYQGHLILPQSSPHLTAVVDLDVGKRDRQQCADTNMRLRGEYHYYRGKPDRTRFRWAGGKRFGYGQWRQGIRPVKQGRRWAFERKARPGRGYGNFRRYLGFMFSWTGTMHQMGEPRVRKPQQLRAGDFFIQGGSPGHIVVILDLARGPGDKLRALIGQGFMPAQDLHVLRAPGGSPWFELDFAKQGVTTPLWRPFSWRDLRRFQY